MVVPEEFDAVTQAALEQTMQKYGDDMIRLLEVMAGRLETLERTTDRLQRTFVSIKEENQKHDKCKVDNLKSLEADCKNCLQGIQVIEEQKRALLEKKAEFSAARAKAESREAESAPMAPLSTSKVPIDKVIKDVSAMGFTEDEVRTIVKKLTEKGQSVDLNVVLDKLMNGEGAAAPATQKKKGWFGRG
eukprot:gene20057-24012_t